MKIAIENMDGNALLNSSVKRLIDRAIYCYPVTAVTDGICTRDKARQMIAANAIF